MTFHELGNPAGETIVLLHPSATMWDYFELVNPYLKDQFHLVIPALPGYDENHPEEDFTSVEQVARDIEDWLLEHGKQQISGIYGCSMGGSVVILMLASGRVKISSAYIDGGITPYQLPWIVTRFIAIKDWCLLMTGKLGGRRLLAKAFAAGETTDQDLAYIERVLRFMSSRTIWRTFESCNNYAMPDGMVETDCHIIYSYGDGEAAERKDDIAYVKGKFPHAQFRIQPNIGHGMMAASRPEDLARQITDNVKGE